MQQIESNSDKHDIILGLLNYEHKEDRNPSHSIAFRFNWYACYDSTDGAAYLYFQQSCADTFIDSIVRKCSLGRTQYFRLNQPFSQSTNQHTYFEDIAQIHTHLLSGDCYQINYAQRFESTYQGTPWEAFKTLCGYTDAPYCIYSNLDNQQVLCFSPELFLEFQKGQVRTKPIKAIASLTY